MLRNLTKVQIIQDLFLIFVVELFAQLSFSHYFLEFSSIGVDCIKGKRSFRKDMLFFLLCSSFYINHTYTHKDYLHEQEKSIA